MKISLLFLSLTIATASSTICEDSGKAKWKKGKKKMTCEKFKKALTTGDITAEKGEKICNTKEKVTKKKEMVIKDVCKDTCGACPPLSKIELLYGPLVSEDKFVRLDNYSAYFHGVADTPKIGTNAIVDSFESGDFSFEQVETICLTKCGNNNMCTGIYVVQLRGATGLPETALNECIMFNPTLGPALITDSEIKTSDLIRATVFYKVGSYRPLEYEDFVCDVPSDPDVLAAGINCLLQGPEPCNLSDDFRKYNGNSAACVAMMATFAGQNPETALSTCLNCIAGATGNEILNSKIGHADSCKAIAIRNCNLEAGPPGASYFGPGGLCAASCAYPDCISLLQSSINCQANGPIGLNKNGNMIGSCINDAVPGLDKYTCPGADFGAPTQEDYISLFEGTS